MSWRSSLKGDDHRFVRRAPGSFGLTQTPRSAGLYRGRNPPEEDSHAQGQDAHQLLRAFSEASAATTPTVSATSITAKQLRQNNGFTEGDRVALATIDSRRQGDAEQAIQRNEEYKGEYPQRRDTSRVDYGLSHYCRL